MIDRLAEVSSLENQIALSTNDVPREAEVKVRSQCDRNFTFN